MIGVALLAVGDAEAVDGACLEVHHLKVGLGMPDGEGAVVGYGVKEISAIRADAGVADTSLTEERVDLGADGACSLVEGDADEAVLQVLNVPRQAYGVCSAVVDVLAVRRECGEGLEFQTVAE